MKAGAGDAEMIVVTGHIAGNFRPFEVLLIRISLFSIHEASLHPCQVGIASQILMRGSGALETVQLSVMKAQARTRQVRITGDQDIF